MHALPHGRFRGGAAARNCKRARATAALGDGGGGGGVVAGGGGGGVFAVGTDSPAVVVPFSNIV